MPFYKVAKEKDRIEIYFEDFPSWEIRKYLKAYNWWWDEECQCWHNKYNQESLDFASRFCPPAKDNNNNSAPATAEKGYCGQCSTWIYYNSILMIFGSGDIYGYNYDQLDQSPWNHLRSHVKTVIINDGIKSIGKRAFYNFSELTGVVLPDSLTEIGDRAFSKCRNLTLVDLPKRLEFIGAEAFKDCVSIKVIHVPVSVKKLGEDCFKNWNNNQKIYVAKRNNLTGQATERAYSPKEVNASTVAEIAFEDFVTVTTNNYCVNNGHPYEDIQARVKVLRKDGTTYIATIPAGYCKACKKYVIGLWQYNNLRKHGVILCRMVHESWEKHEFYGDYYEDLSPESILKQYGYSVNIEDDLTDEQRKRILYLLIYKKVCSKQKIISHLSWLIHSREGQMNMSNAISKWRQDRDFVDKYNTENARIVGMKSLLVHD